MPDLDTAKTTKAKNGSVLQSCAQAAVAAIEDIIFANSRNHFRDNLEIRINHRLGQEIERLRKADGNPHGVVALYEESYGLIPKFLDKSKELAELKRGYKEKIIKGLGTTVAVSAAAVTLALAIPQYMGSFYINPFAGGGIVLLCSSAAATLYKTIASGFWADYITYGLPKNERQNYHQFRQSAIEGIVTAYTRTIPT